MNSLVQDIRYAIRTLLKRPTFTAVVVLTLALGIGANTAIFSVIDTVMLKRLPVRVPEQLVLLEWFRPGPHQGISTSGYGHSDVRSSFSYPFFQEIQNHTDIFSDVFGFAPLGVLNMNIDGQPGVITAEGVSGNYFSALGVQPVLGRVITAQDATPDSAGVAVISHRYWTRQFGRNPSLLEKKVTINGLPFTIVGIAPPEFFGVEPGRAPDIWIPLSEHWQLGPWGERGSDRSPFTDRNWWWVMVMARVRPGITDQTVSARLDPLLQREINRLIESGADPSQPATIIVTPAARGLERLRQQFSQPLTILIVLTALILLIACLNVAGALLARAMSRQREINVRLALGATRWRLMRQLLTESMVLALLGGLLGGVLVYWSTESLLAILVAGYRGVSLSVEPNLRILGFTAGVSLLVGILFGLIPSLGLNRLSIISSLRAEADTTFGNPQRSNLGRILVVAQVCLSMVMLVAAGLLVRTVANLTDQELGFDPESVTLFRLDPNQKGYQNSELVGLYGQLLDRIRALPGTAASFSRMRLISGTRSISDVLIESRRSKPSDMSVYWNVVAPGFFETMRIPILAGRDLERQDADDAPDVAVVNQVMAQRFFGGESPLGRRVRLRDQIYEIIGIAGNAKYDNLRQEPPPTLYLSYRQAPVELGAVHFAVRSALEPGDLIANLRHIIRELDQDLPMIDVSTQSTQIESAATEEKLFAGLASFFGLLGIVITSIGLYGLLAYSVSGRTREIGMRMTLGADRNGILRMVVGQGLRITLIGIGAGLAGVFLLGGFLQSFLYGISPTDPITLAVVAATLLAVAFLACLIPARRAARVDPMKALRYE